MGLCNRSMTKADQVRDTANQNGGLARTGTGKDQQRAAGVADGVALLRIHPAAGCGQNLMFQFFKSGNKRHG